MFLPKLILLELAQKYNLDPTDLIQTHVIVAPSLKIKELAKFLTKEKANLYSLPTLAKFNKFIGAPAGKLIDLNTFNSMLTRENLTKANIAKAIVVFSERAASETNPQVKERYLKLAQFFRELYNVVKDVEFGRISVEEGDKRILEILKKQKK
jgi:hypothetical protein